MGEKRICRICEDEKDEEEFYLNRVKGNGKIYECRRTLEYHAAQNRLINGSGPIVVDLQSS